MLNSKTYNAFFLMTIACLSSPIPASAQATEAAPTVVKPPPGTINLESHGGMKPELAIQYERGSRRAWDIFYKRNSTHFFKDRHWIQREFPQLAGEVR